MAGTTIAVTPESRTLHPGSRDDAFLPSHAIGDRRRELMTSISAPLKYFADATLQFER